MPQIPQFTDDLGFISRLGDNPNTDDGLSAQALKEEFDKAPKAIQQFINNYIIPSLNNYIMGNGYLQTSGGYMTGPIVMQGNKVSKVGAPTDSDDASTKEYTDNAVNAVAKAAAAADTKAGNAASAASTAQSTADAAKTAASNAASAASTAQSTADAAKTAASNAASAASTAQSTANTANTTAKAALPKAGGSMTGYITTKGIKLTSGTDYGTSLPAAGTAGRLFFKKVSS